MNLSVCIDALYMNKNFDQSVKDTKNAGFDTIEFWSWWDKDIELVEKTIEESGVQVSTFCTKFISLVDSNQRENYIDGLKQSIEVAKKLNCNRLISQVGQELTDVSRQEQKQSLVDGLKACVPILEKENITLLIEPLNTYVDHQGYYLSKSEEAFEIIKKIGSNHVKVLYDIYHQQITEGNIISTIENNIDLIGHFHAAGNPGRHELDSGELNYNRIFEAIDLTGYTGFVGLEYFPKADPTIGLKKLR
ncbi:TIM barrel protein [Aquibacillus halophilus]|uniref:TIM barrel protein n=1 Tax=Aquibacillus halophilus TaxID=930132 RepID=A0A6A8D677_9BACI|nr:TIM barrel protein [Aquibacillus halophilus]MRH41088.1 TIM barrel protein [Aquibacillus halophilus]